MDTYIPIWLSSSSLSNQHQLRLAMKTSPLRRITPNKTLLHLRISSSLSGTRTTMADEATKIGQSGGDTSSSEKKDKVPEKLPPPPEKPLLDDCCGSGCVRCVWDIYYDELEAYNKLISESENKVNSDS